MQNDILRTVDHGGVAVLVLLDLSAAFDTIDHSILLYRMRHQLGINGVAHAWFESYLTGRTQRIQIGDAWSLAKFLLYCVHQGSVLGSLLFLIYILPLHHLILSHGLQVHGYADDTQVYLSISDPANPDTTRQECTRLESCLTDIHLWMSANKLKLNTDKTEVLVVGTERKLSSFNLTAISVAGCRVLVSDKPISNLGVSFDRNLSMCNQVHRVVRSAYFHLRSIGLARKMLTVAATKQLVQALVISRLDYCNSLLTGIPTSLMSRLEMVQHRAARLIFRSSGHQSVTVLMKDLHFPCPLQGPCPSIQVQKWTWSGVFDQYALCLHSSPWLMFSYGLLVEPRSRLKTVGDRAFSVAGPREWNRLPGEIRDCQTLGAFKRMLKTHLFRAAYGL